MAKGQRCRQRVMILTNIKTSRIPNRVNLIFSNKSYLPLFIDDVVKLSLKKNQKIDSQKLTLIIDSSLKYLGREYALRQIAISPKSEKVLSQKLKLFFFKKIKKFKLFSKNPNTIQIIREIISDLKSKNLLNQSDYISYFIKKNKSKSKFQIKFLLNQQGIKIDSLDFDQISPKNDLVAIKKILAKKNISSLDLTDFKSKNKLFSSLFRRGFHFDDIQTAIDDLIQLK